MEGSKRGNWRGNVVKRCKRKSKTTRIKRLGNISQVMMKRKPKNA